MNKIEKMAQFMYCYADKKTEKTMNFTDYDVQHLQRSAYREGANYAAIEFAKWLHAVPLAIKGDLLYDVDGDCKTIHELFTIWNNEQ